MSQQWLYKLQGKFIFKTLFCITFVFLLRFYLTIDIFLHLYNVFLCDSENSQR